MTPDAEDAVCARARGARGAARASTAAVAGQHVVVRATIDGEDTRRTYSLVNAPGEWPLRIVPRVHAHGQHVALSGRAAARRGRARGAAAERQLHAALDPRRALATYVAFAAGCGITPVLSVVARAAGAARRRRVILFYGNRGTARTMCLEELLALKDRYLERLALHFVMSREPQEVELYNGRIDAAHGAPASPRRCSSRARCASISSAARAT